MDKHTPLTKINEEQKKKNLHQKNNNIQSKESKNNKKSKAPFLPAQMNK
jgi:hypothetical protein